MFPFYKQLDSMDCAPACLRMMAKYYNREISLQALRERAQIGKEGVNLLGISEAAESVGFRTRSLRLNYHSLVTKATLPAILHWNQNHFVVLYKVRRGKCHIADPARGLVVLDAKEFRSNWISHLDQGEEEGIALLLEPAPAFYEQQPDSGLHGQRGMSYGNILYYILPYRKLIFQLFLGLGIASILQLILPFLTQSVVDTGVNTANIQFVYIILFAQLALFAGRIAIEFVRSWILLHIGTRVNISILTDFLIKLMKLPVSFFDSKNTGDILQRMNDHSRIESFLTGSSLNMLFSLINLLVFSVVLAVFNTGIFAVFLVASTLYGAWVILFMKRRRALDYRKFEVTAKEQSVSIQLVQGMQEIKLNGAERPMRWTWERLQARLFGLNMKSLALNQWQQSGAFFVNEGKNIFITFLSAKAVIDGQMTLGSMLAIQYIIGQLNSPIEQMIGFVQSWQNARISLERLNEVHTLEDEEPADKNLLQELPASFARQVAGGRMSTIVTRHEHNASPFVQAPGYLAGKERGDEVSIHFRNVSFTYPGAGNEPVLRNINLAIPKGKTTAIVGMSGSGKTSLLKLLLKFYEPQKGEIYLDHTPLSGISHTVWRNRCGVVMQESFIFSDTIARNIAVGQEKIDTGRLYHAVAAANIKEFIDSLPLRYNTKIGAEGTGLSMGQKQRILIARAVYRDPDFIFFDEATNSLDANNEMIILRNLESFFKNRTVIVVAHRLSTVKHADQIIVLDKGIITESGTHDELTRLRTGYYHLVKNQLELGA